MDRSTQIALFWLTILVLFLITLGLGSWAYYESHNDSNSNTNGNTNSNTNGNTNSNTNGNTNSNTNSNTDTFLADPSTVTGGPGTNNLSSYFSTVIFNTASDTPLVSGNTTLGIYDVDDTRSVVINNNGQTSAMIVTFTENPSFPIYMNLNQAGNLCFFNEDSTTETPLWCSNTINQGTPPYTATLTSTELCITDANNTQIACFGTEINPIPPSS